MDSVEIIRAQYRPNQITTLFVGESAPASGDFFYVGNSAMLLHMQRAVETSLGASDEHFLARFKSYGWYLDDLVLTPVNALPNRERISQCRAAKSSLAVRITQYRPVAIVSLLYRISDIVEAAAIEANSDAPRFVVPFPGMGQQGRFKTAMAEILPKLPRLE